MDGDDRRRGKLRSFALGGLLGASAVLATARRRRKRKRPLGLRAFEEAPCYRETVERDQHEPRARART